MKFESSSQRGTQRSFSLVRTISGGTVQRSQINRNADKCALHRGYDVIQLHADGASHCLANEPGTAVRRRIVYCTRVRTKGTNRACLPANKSCGRCGDTMIVLYCLLPIGLVKRLRRPRPESSFGRPSVGLLRVWRPCKGSFPVQRYDNTGGGSQETFSAPTPPCPEDRHLEHEPPQDAHHISINRTTLGSS